MLFTKTSDEPDVLSSRAFRAASFGERYALSFLQFVVADPFEVGAAHLRGRAIGGMPADGGGEVAGDPCGK